jgi:hypothetical protein
MSELAAFFVGAVLRFVSFHVDLGFAASMTNETTSGVLFHNSTNHDRFQVYILHNCSSTPHDGLCVDLGSGATTTIVTTSGVLFHNSTTHHDCSKLILALLLCIAISRNFLKNKKM